MSRTNPANHQPFTVECTLASPVITSHPILLDGILHFATGAVAGSRRADGLGMGSPELAAMRLPLSRCHWHGARGAGDRLWWFAASQATPWGREERSYLHRRPATDAAIRWSDARGMGIGTGPDKALRIPQYRRVEMTRIRWTGVGDIDEVAWLLGFVPGIGDNSGHGHGWVQRWDVRRGGPPFLDYLRDLRLRHLPAEIGDQRDLRWAGRVVRKRLPLTPPYHERARAVPVVQVGE